LAWTLCHRGGGEFARELCGSQREQDCADDTEGKDAPQLSARDRIVVNLHGH